MKSLKAFFQLIRWSNLAFIAITQLLFYYCIIYSILPNAYYTTLVRKLTPTVFLFVIGASLCIAAAGYVINDYFDINIDRINKPSKMVVEKTIARRWAILLHMTLNIIGVVLSYFAAIKSSSIILPANIICTMLLWSYSSSFKKKLLTGNIIIAMLTAWVIIVLYFSANTIYLKINNQSADVVAALKLIFKFAVLYAGFAFIVSLIREVVKDMEDMEGDEKYGCKTMPIVWGIPPTKVFVSVWIWVLVGAISIMVVYMLLSWWWICGVYCIALLIVPLLLVFKQFTKAETSKDYHAISSKLKWIMLAGIFSMAVIRIYL